MYVWQCGNHRKYIKTLISDSEIVYHKLVGKVCQRYGRLYPEAFLNELYGHTDRDVAIKVVQKLNLPISHFVFEAELEKLAAANLKKVALRPGLYQETVLLQINRTPHGAERLLKHLYELNIPLALATNSSSNVVKLHEQYRPALFSVFHHKVTATDKEVSKGKPYPDILIVAANRFPKKPKFEDCLVFEDSLAGVQAANSAGMQVVMVPARTMDRETNQKATLVINSLLEFKPELFGLPPFGSTTK